MGEGTLSVLVAAGHVAESWQLWLATRLAKAGFRVDLMETDGMVGGDWQARETARIAPRLDRWFDRPALEAMLVSASGSSEAYELAVCGNDAGLRSSRVAAARLGAVVMEPTAHPEPARIGARLSIWTREAEGAELRERGAREVKPQVAPGDDFDTIWLRLLVEASRNAVSMVEEMARGEAPAAGAPEPRERRKVSWAEAASFRLNGRGLRSRDVLQTGFMG
jgi:hypothetical protein